MCRTAHVQNGGSPEHVTDAAIKDTHCASERRSVLRCPCSLSTRRSARLTLVDGGKPDVGNEPMKYVMNYSFKPYMGKDETARMMETFGTVGEAPGRTQHLVRVDGTGGTVIGETDDLDGMYRNVVSCSEWVEFDLSAVLAGTRRRLHATIVDDPADLVRGRRVDHYCRRIQQRRMDA